MKSTKMIKELVEETTVNEDGEILQENRKITYGIAREPDFVKLYLDDLAKLEGLPKSVAAVFYGLLKYMTYADEDGGQIVILNSYAKKQILLNSKSIKSTQTINNAIVALKKVGLLTAIDQSTFRINPAVIGKGEWRDIAELRLNIVYNSSGRHIKTETVRKDNSNEKVIEFPVTPKMSAEETETKKSA